MTVAATVGLQTQDPATGKLYWPGMYHEITGVRYTNHYGGSKGGGPATFTCKVVLPPGDKPVGIAVGYLLRVWRGAENVWTGTINQPDVGGDGIGVTAEGIGPGMGGRWVATEMNNALFMDINVDAAIVRGLPWKRTSTAPFYFGAMNPGTTLEDALNELAKQTGREWAVTPDGALYWSTPRVDVTHLLWAYGQGGTRTLDNFATDMYATYMPVEDAQIDAVETAPSTVSGTAWGVDASPHRSGAGELSAYTLGASNGQKLLFDYSSGALTPADLRGYKYFAYWVAQAGGTAVTRHITITLYTNAGPTWALPTSTVTVPANNVWTQVKVDISNPPGGFPINDIRGYFINTDGGIYFDDVWALSPIQKNVFGVYMPQITAEHTNTAARAKYGRYEASLDLTGQGPISSGEAETAAGIALTKYGYRTRWTQPFIATADSLTTPNGVPVDLASVPAGARVRVMLADLNEPESGTTGDQVEFVVAETDYDNDNETLSLTPIESERKDLITLLGNALPKGRGK